MAWRVAPTTMMQSAVGSATKGQSELQRYALKLLPTITARQPQNQSCLTVEMEGAVKSRSGWGRGEGWRS